MRHSANLNIILKSIQKASEKLPRDLFELENLQNNHLLSSKFAVASYKRVKQIIINDLTKIRPDFNMRFIDGEKIITNNNAQYNFIICPIEGLNNLSRSNPNFAVGVALTHIDEKTNEEIPIAATILNIMGRETYYCEKGLGGYVNNRKLRCSKRSIKDEITYNGDLKIISGNFDVKDSYILNYFDSGSNLLNLAYFTSAKLDLVVLKKNKEYEYLKPFLIFAKEAGGVVKELENYVIIKNSQI